ncbi:MAG: C1 family peptidase [Firmicutes bacterium]|nr:C1 family peptidase [Bacillota bacterium]
MRGKWLSVVLSMMLLASAFGTLGMEPAFAVQSASRADGAFETGEGQAAISGLRELGHMKKTENGIQFVMKDESLLEAAVPAVTESKSVSEGPSVSQASFSLVEAGYIPAVRNQKHSNNCWAYGAIASLESNLLLTGQAEQRELDLSENHLAWFTYKGKNESAKSRYAGKDTYRAWQTGKPYQEGGNRWFSAATLARWYGAVDQSRARSASPLSSKLQTISDIRLKNADFLPNPKTEGSRNTIKQYLITKGAISMNYYHRDGLVKKKAGKTVYYCGTKKIPNHEVTIVGWDDSVPAGKGRGAWLVRNSYGKEWGDDGYFYLSYYDRNLCNPTFFEAEAQPYQKGGTSHDASGVYQYDGVGAGDAEFSSSKPVSVANRYKARRNELIQAVCTYTGTANSTVKVSIYLNPSPKDPASGRKAYSGSFTIPYAGHHTLELERMVGVPKGCEFSVVIKTSYKAGGKRCYFLPVETQSTQKKLIVSIDCGKGQSYVKMGKHWKDATSIKPFSGGGSKYKMGNALAKAFTVGAGSSKQAIDVKTKREVVYSKKTFQIQAKRTEGDGALLYRSSNRKVAVVSSLGKIRLKGPGKVTISVMAAPSKDCKAAVKKVCIIVKPKPSGLISAKSAQKGTAFLTWNKVEKSSGYQLTLARDKAFKKGRVDCFVDDHEVTEKTVKKLSSGKTYYVKTRAFQTAGKKKIFGDYSKIKKVTIKK